MARAGRSHPNRPIVVRHPRMFSRYLALDAFEIEIEFPALAVTTPDARVLLGAFEIEAEFPELTFSYSVGLTLDAFEIEAEFPALTVSIPVQPGDSLTGGNGEAEWNGTLWGPTTSVKVLIPVEGWLSAPQIDNLNTPRPNRHGAWSARKLTQQRLVTLRLQPDSASDPTQVDTLIDEILAVTGIADDDTELPLVIKGYGSATVAYGAVIDRDVVMDGDYGAGLPTVVVLIACSDPRRYGLIRQGATVPVGQLEQVGNTGNTATHPLIRLAGPVVNPVLTNQDTDRTLAFSISVAAGQTLEIDTDHGTVTVDGVNQMSTLTGAFSPVQDFTLIPGSNSILYDPTSGGSEGADFLWRDATL